MDTKTAESARLASAESRVYAPQRITMTTGHEKAAMRYFSRTGRLLTNVSTAIVEQMEKSENTQSQKSRHRPSSPIEARALLLQSIVNSLAPVQITIPT